MFIILKKKKDDKNKTMKKLYLLFLFTTTSLFSQNESNIIKDLPNEITVKYGTDILPNEKTALSVAEIILKERYLNTKFDKLKPFKINLHFIT